MVEGLELLGYVFLLSFGLCSLGIGAVTANFGSGVSRKIGIITAIVGVVFLAVFGIVACEPVEIIKFSIMTGLGAAIGAILGLAIFLVAIMKS